MQPREVSEERSARSASPSLLTATVGQRVLSRLDDGSGCTSPERVAALWTEEGIGNSRDILQVRESPFYPLMCFCVNVSVSVSEQPLLCGSWISLVFTDSVSQKIKRIPSPSSSSLIVCCFWLFFCGGCDLVLM